MVNVDVRPQLEKKALAKLTARAKPTPGRVEKRVALIQLLNATLTTVIYSAWLTLLLAAPGYHDLFHSHRVQPNVQRSSGLLPLF